MSVRNRKEKKEDTESDDKLTDDFSASENEKSDKDKDKDDINNKNVSTRLNMLISEESEATLL